MNARTYVLLEIGEALYALDVRCVIGVIEVVGVTRVPGTPEWVLGVINVRGRVLPLGDLAVALGERESGNGQGGSTALLLAMDGGDAPSLAIGGDVIDVVEVEQDRLEPPPRFGLSAAAALVSGVAHLGTHGLALVLDPELLGTTLGVGGGVE